MQDLKVLGKKEFRTLAQMAIEGQRQVSACRQGQEATRDEDAEAKEGEEVAEVEPMDEELQAARRDTEAEGSGEQGRRKERRKENERKRKEIIRMQLHMTAPFEIGLEQHGPAGEGGMFNIKTADRARDPKRTGTEEMRDDNDAESDASEADESEDEDEVGDRLETELDVMYETFQQRREEADAKARAKRARKEKETDEWGGLSDEENKEGDVMDAETDGEDRHSLRELPKSEGLSTKAAMFFDQDIFQDLGIEDDDDKDSAIEMDDSSSDQAKPVVTKSKPAKEERRQTKALKSALKKAQPTTHDGGWLRLIARNSSVHRSPRRSPDTLRPP